MSTTFNDAGYPAPEAIEVVGVIGTGSVGASWAALFLAHGMRVLAHDPAAGAEDAARSFVANAWPALMDLLGTPQRALPAERLVFLDSIEAVARGAQMIQENSPERPEVKSRVIGAIDAAASPDKLILSSTGGIFPTELQKACRHPERFVVMHPFNPAHLIPLVEVVAGQSTAPAATAWAMAFARRCGKHPIALLREATGHLTNRLQFSLLREAVHCLAEGIASPTDIDAAVRLGLGPRWALMGGLLTMHMAGGAGGMRGILDHAGDAIEGWWASLGQPHLDAATRAKLLAAADEVAAGHSIAEWAAWRDRHLAHMVKLIRQEDGPAALSA